MPTTESQVLTIEQAGRMLGISRWSAYEHAKAGSLGGVPVLKIGRRLVVPRPALEAVLRGETLPRTAQNDNASIEGSRAA